MRLKRLLYILPFALLYISAFTACEKKTETTEPASETKLTGIVFAKNDSFPGIEKASFTIDFSQDTAQVYNLDSLPCGTRLDSVVASFYFTTSIGYAIFTSDSTEKLLSVSDTLNFNPRPCRLHVMSEDQKHERYYHIYVNVHKVDPDLYVWSAAKENLFAGNCDVHAENLNGQVQLYTQDGINVRLYRTGNGTTWTGPFTPTGLPKDANVRQIIQGKTQLYYTQDNQLYSSADGLTWTAADCSATGLQLLNMLFCYNDSIWAIAKETASDSLCFATFVEGGTPARQHQIGSLDKYCRMAGETFPVSDYSAVTYFGKSGRLRAMIMGGFDAEGNALNSRWNLEWLQTDDDKGEYRLENFTIEQPSFKALTGTAVLWYDEKMLLFGSADINNTIGEYPMLESVDEGMNWTVPDSTENMLPTNYVNRQRLAAAVTDDGTILLIGGQNRTTSFTDVWKGKKNSIDWE